MFFFFHLDGGGLMVWLKLIVNEQKMITIRKVYKSGNGFVFYLNYFDCQHLPTHLPTLK